jgi:hypothetical protein
VDIVAVLQQPNGLVFVSPRHRRGYRATHASPLQGDNKALPSVQLRVTIEMINQCKCHHIELDERYAWD